MYALGFYIPEEGILHAHRRENLKTYMWISGQQNDTEEIIPRIPINYLF
jgi:hypothetical protein